MWLSPLAFTDPIAYSIPWRIVSFRPMLASARGLHGARSVGLLSRLEAEFHRLLALGTDRTSPQPRVPLVGWVMRATRLLRSGDDIWILVEAAGDSAAVPGSERLLSRPEQPGPGPQTHR
jgi:hypothetical protein